MGPTLYTPNLFLSLVVLGSTGIDTVRDNIRAINLNIGPGRSPGPDIIMALGGNQTTYLSPLLSGSTSSDMLPPTEIPLLSPITHSTFVHQNNALPGTARWAGVLSLKPGVGPCGGLLALLSLPLCLARTYFLLRAHPRLCGGLLALLCSSWRERSFCLDII